MPFKIAALVALIVAILVAGVWGIQRTATDFLLQRDAVGTGELWARYLAENVSDLPQIAAGERPLPESRQFFEKAQRVGQVFRYKIFAADGRLRLVSDELGAGEDSRPLAEHNKAAADAIAAGQPLVIAKEGKPPHRPQFFSEAYVPLMIGGRTAAIVEVYVDQTEKRNYFRLVFWSATVALSLLILAAFGLPAFAWHRRTKEKIRADEHIQYLAYHDSLTGLPNRNRFVEQLTSTLATLQADQSAAVLCLDLDRFKAVNDTLGHDAGDLLLQTVAARLRQAVGTDGLAARLGGDEFAVLLYMRAGVLEAAELAARIMELTSKPFTLNGHEVATGISIGVAFAPTDGKEPTRLLKSADLALQRSKDEGRGCVRYFAPEMDAELTERLVVENALKQGLTHNRFVLHYQPVVKADKGGSLVGFEALLRLTTDSGRSIPPASFIPVAEEMGLITQVGEWVIQEACRTAMEWPDHLTVAVNLSPAQFAAGGVYEVVKRALRMSGLNPRRLELEITEGLLLSDADTILKQLAKLKALGVAVVMDDFGTGYSSLSYLWRFPFDKIKIDRAFMQAFENEDAHVETVVRTIVALGRSLDMRVTVEGVESERQAEFIRGINCDEIQGFLFGRPRPASDLASEVLAGFQRAQAPALALHEAKSNRRSKAAGSYA